MLYLGIVQRGQGRGKTLGFPTANIPLTTDISGIYAAHVWVMNKEYKAAVYADKKRKLLEAHLLEYSGELFGRDLEVQIMRKIRDDAQFESEEKLKAQIEADIVAVRKFFTG